MPTHCPKSANDIASIVFRAKETGSSLTVNSIEPSDAQSINIDTRLMNKIVDAPFDDMTITVQSGMTCAELNQLLLQHNQQLPIDIADPKTTIGNLVAANLFGPRVTGYGTVRDFLIGIEAVDGAGRIFRSGGRVVKNVAGYDLCRLMIGSYGRLGIITECTFKLNPLPTRSAGLRIHCETIQSLESCLRALNSSAARPVIINLHAPADVAEEFRIFVGVEGTQKSCDWQRNEIQKECGASKTDFLDNESVKQQRSCFTSFWREGQMRIRTLRSNVAPLVGFLRTKSVDVKGYAGNGILHCVDDDQLASDIMTSLPNLDVEIDRSAAQSFPVAHCPPNSHTLNQQFLTTFDPDSIFKPS